MDIYKNYSLNVAFRVDIGENIGIGHYTRMSALAEVFVQLGCMCSFFKSEDEPIDYTNFDIIILDTYQISDNYIASVNRLNRLLVCYDDNALYTYDCDILLNANIHAEALKFKLHDKKPIMLLGPQYALLRQEFREAQPIVVRKNPTEVLICFGGSDVRGFTPFTVQALQGMLDTNITVILGAYTQCDEEVYALEGKTVRVFKNPSTLSEIMFRCDIAITAGGSMIYELAALGLPTLIITQADNQHAATSCFNHRKLMKCIGDWESIRSDTIRMEAENLLKDTKRRERESQQLRETVDQNGALNAACAILECLQ